MGLVNRPVSRLADSTMARWRVSQSLRFGGDRMTTNRRALMVGLYITGTLPCALGLVHLTVRSGSLPSFFPGHLRFMSDATLIVGMMFLILAAMMSADAFRSRRRHRHRSRSSRSSSSHGSTHRPLYNFDRDGRSSGPNTRSEPSGMLSSKSLLSEGATQRQGVGSLRVWLGQRGPSRRGVGTRP